MFCTGRTGLTPAWAAARIRDLHVEVKRASAELEELVRRRKDMVRRIEAHEVGNSREERDLWINFWGGEQSLGDVMRGAEEEITAVLSQRETRDRETLHHK